VGLSAAHKADRLVMADKIYEILSACQSAETKHIRWAGKRAVAVSFRHDNGMAVTVEFDGDSAQDREGVFCMAWHVSGWYEGETYISHENTQYSEGFGLAMNCSVNPFHRRKCTAFAYGFDDLCRKLTRAVEMFNDGSAVRK
jgi:hypothetical protein